MYKARYGTAATSPTPPPTFDPLMAGAFNALHSGGANFAFGDGHVRFLSEAIDFKVYQLMGHRADGQVIGDERY